MPKLRDRKTLSAPAQYARTESSDSRVNSNTDHWTRAETKALLAAVRQHGTGDLQRLADAVGTRTKDSIRHHLRHLRTYRSKNVSKEQQTTPLDDWMEIMQLASPEAELRQCVDQTAVTGPLLLAADEEERLAAAEQRSSLAGVYRFLAGVASGVMPPEPSESDARRLVALTHHLAVLLKTINLSRHKRWLWSSQLLRKLADGDPEIAASPAPAPDLSLAPASLRPLIGRLLEPSTNPLRTTAALIINPLATQLNVEASGSDHLLLDDPDRLWQRLLTTAKPEETDEREARETTGVPAGAGVVDHAPPTAPVSAAGAPSTSAAGSPAPSPAPPTTGGSEPEAQAPSPAPPTAGGSEPAAQAPSPVPPTAGGSEPEAQTSTAPGYTKPRLRLPPLKMASGGWIQSRKSKHQEKETKKALERMSAVPAPYSENGEALVRLHAEQSQEHLCMFMEDPDSEEGFISIARKFPSRGRVRTYGKSK